MEQDRLPDTEELERLADVVVRAPVIVIQIKRIILLKVRSGTDIHALGPSELRTGHELLRELMLQFRQHSVVVAMSRNSPVIAATDLRIQRVASSRRNSIRILVKEDVAR